MEILSRCEGAFGPGPHRFVLAMPAGEDFLFALLAGLLGGHTIIPTALPRAGAKGDRLAGILQDSVPTAVFCHTAGREALCRHLHRELTDPVSSVLCPVLAIDAPWPEMSAAGRSGKHDDALSDEPAIIQYTSGSTRTPKGVKLGGEQILANQDLVARTWDMSPDTRFVNWLPHYHDMGLMGGILYPLLAGAYSVQMSPLEMIRRPVSWLKAISDFRATFSGGPAFAFAECLKRIPEEESAELDLSRWIRAYCGAEPIPSGLLPAFRERFASNGLKPEAVFGCYGLAENTLFAAGAPEPDATLSAPPAGCASVHPCRLTETTRPYLRIVDPEDGRPLPEGQQGEIWLTGPSRARGYLGLPVDSRTMFEARMQNDPETPWLRTGDLGVIAGDFLYVNGRLKDTIIVYGRTIAAAEVEWLAATVDATLNPLAAAAFQPDPAAGDAVVLFIELRPGCLRPSHPHAVHSAITRALMGEWAISLKELRIVPRGRLERTTSGKIRRQRVAEAYRRGEAPKGLELP